MYIIDGKKDIKSMNLEELRAEIEEAGLPKFRADQIYKWVHSSVTSFDEMTNLSKDLRVKLNELYVIPGCQIELKRVSKLDGTVKYLYKLYDGDYIEAVVMKYHHGNSICISSQVGCKMGCNFCATGKNGFTRNLLPSEMLSQVMTAQKDIGERISNIVLMGMGEPLDNYDNVIKFLELISDENGLNIGMRHISLSTCGLVNRIYELADKNLQLTLSVSLHAPNDELRNSMMPVNRRWNVDELLEACRYYCQKTNKRISFEYAMISGKNDSDAHAKELASKLKGIIAHVNLIPVNDVTGTGYRKSNSDRLNKFVKILSERGYTATIRRTLGSDIEASCGQLKGKALDTGRI